MPLPQITLDDRKYQDLLDEALRRIPVHTPEWTNFNKSDPGVTLLELFAFLTETLLYRVNRIPERNRRKFLSLLGIPLKAASSAEGLVTFQNERGPREAMLIPKGHEVSAGEVPFYTEQGLELLPIEAKIYVKQPLEGKPPDELMAYYRQLYESYGVGGGDLEEWRPVIYDTVPFPGPDGRSLRLQDTVGQSAWVALLVRESDKPSGTETMNDLKARVRQRIAGKTLSLGVVPTLAEPGRTLPPLGQATLESETPLIVERPRVVREGELEEDRVPRYTPMETRSDTNVFAFPGIVQVSLPPAEQLMTWTELEPLEAGVGDFPPPLEDTALNARLITWLRIRVPSGIEAKLHWVGINATRVKQRAHVFNEPLSDGTGEPDQARTLVNRPVIPGTVKLTVGIEGQPPTIWEEIDDLMSAGPEVPTSDLRLPPGRQSKPAGNRYVFQLNPESGELRFGDGTHGARPPFGALIRASYDYGAGSAGNVNEGAITSGPLLPAGVKVTNPVRTWGGAEAESVAEGEKQIARYLQHRDRLVTAEDFQTIVRRTPGVDINRVEVVPVFNPQLVPNEPGDAPGAVTIMVIPAHDADNPDAPVPNRIFLDTICRYINPRRLVTTEVFLQGPQYVDIWVSIGIDIQAGESIAEVREAVRRAVAEFLSPMSRLTAEEEARWQERLKEEGRSVSGEALEEVYAQRRGWPLRKAVVDLELVTVASRVRGVLFVNKILVAKGTEGAKAQIPMGGLELPRPRVFVTVGTPLALDELRGEVAGGLVPQPTVPRVVPVPAIPEVCR